MDLGGMIKPKSLFLVLASASALAPFQSSMAEPTVSGAGQPNAGNLEKSTEHVRPTGSNFRQFDKDPFADARKRAQALEDTGKPGASYEWASLARQYFDQQQYSQGTACMLHALSIHSAEYFNNGMYHPGNLRGDLGYTVLVKAKHFDDAEKILKKCLEAHKTFSYAKSAFIEKFLLSELFIEESRYDEAKKWADELLATFTQDDGICRRNGNCMRAFVFFSLVDEFTAKEQFRIARQLLDSATKIQLAETGPKNPLFIENYQSQAKLLEAQDQLPQAEEFARKALDLESWVGRSANSGRISSGMLVSILRKEGKSGEAEKISNLHPLPEDRSLYMANVYGVRSASDHSLPPERYVSTAEEPLKKILSERIRVFGEASTEALKSLNDLSRFYVQQKRYNEAEKVQLHQLQMLDEEYGKCNVPKVECYLDLAEIYMFENLKDKARHFAAMVTTLPTDEPVWIRTNFMKSTVRLANVWLYLGDTNKALEYAKIVEKTIVHTPHQIGYVDLDRRIDECADLMSRIGAMKDVDDLKQVKKDFHDPSIYSAGRFPKPPGSPDNE